MPPDIKQIIMPRPQRAEALSDDARLTYNDLCLSRTSGLSQKTEWSRKIKIGKEVAHVTHDSGTNFKVKRSKVNLQGTGAYCGGLPHSLFIMNVQFHNTYHKVLRKQISVD